MSEPYLSIFVGTDLPHQGYQRKDDLNCSEDPVNDERYHINTPLAAVALHVQQKCGTI